MKQSNSTSKNTSSKKISPDDRLILRDESPDDTNESSLAQVNAELGESNSGLKTRNRALTLLLGLSWVLFFDILAFSSMSVGGAFVIGGIELLALLIYMKISGDEYLLTIYRDFIDAWREKGSNKNSSDTDKPTTK